MPPRPAGRAFGLGKAFVLAVTVKALTWAFTTNAASKAVLALSSGGPRFALPVVSGLAVQVAAAWAAAVAL